MPKKSEHDGRYAAQVVRHHTDETHNPTLRRIFVHIDAAHHPHRESKQRAACHQAKSTDDGRQDTAGCHAVCRGARQELPVDDSYTFVYDKTENGKEDAYHTQTKQTEQSERDVLRKMFSTYHILLLSFARRYSFYREVYQQAE